MSAPERALARGLVLAFLSGAWSHEELLARGREALGQHYAELLPIVRLAQRLFPEPPHGREDTATRLLARSRAVRAAVERRPALKIRRWFTPELRMAKPLPQFAQLTLPPLVTAHDLAQLTAIPLEELEWFTDLRRMNRRAPASQLQHYHYRWLPKASGSYRLLEAPKRRLKAAQRQILEQILERVPLHQAAHGHRKHHSVATFVAPHSGKPLVIALDLADFFNVITEARVRALFAALGYSDSVATWLAALCCTPTPLAVLARRPLPPHATPHDMQARFRQRQLLCSSHLPQGAPSSPMLANLIAFKLDVRLAALATSIGANYTRYSDDLAFSGHERLSAALPTFLPLVGAIAKEEGFEVRYRKTRVMRASTRQQLCGLVVNAVPSLQRRELERLEAILVNSIRHGPSSQNRTALPDFRAHLAGRVAWAAHLHPRKGARLRELLTQIAF